MRRIRWTLSLLVVVLLLPAFAWSQDLAVSTDWLQQNLKDPALVILDVRKVEDYRAGHIPGAVNVFYSSWVVKQGDLQNQLPPQDELFEVIGRAGIKPDSTIVVVGKADTIPERTNITRVAWTLKYAGVPKASILDGGQDKWVKEGKTLSKEAKRPAAVKYEGKVNKGMVQTKEYILKNLKNPKVILVDTREVPFYLGEKKLPFVLKEGHIPGARNLPTSKLYNPDGTFKNKQERAMVAAESIGDQTDLEYILYCDTGKVCSAWALALADIGYVHSWTKKGPEIYDGSMEEWTRDANAPVEKGAPAPKK